MKYKTKSSNPINNLEDYFNRKRYSSKTKACYMNHILKVKNFSNKDIYHITSDDFNSFISNCNEKSNSYINQVINAGTLFLKYGLNKNINYISKLDRPKSESKLPNIIPEDLLKSVLSNINNKKHKAILSLTYSIGLRSGDIRNLKVSDIDSKSMQVKIIEGKGNKDAYLPLYNNVLNILREYYKEFKPKEYLFEGQGDNLYSGTSLNKLVKKYIGKQYHFHNLRHSTATHLLNKGVDISFIQKLLRHEKLETTLIYLRITTRDLNKLPQLI